MVARPLCPILVVLVAAALPCEAAPPRHERLFTVAKGVEQAANTRDAEAIDGWVSRETLVERALADVPLSVGERLAMSRDLRRDLHVGVMLVAALGDDGHAKLLAVRRDDGVGRALLRIVHDRTGLNYLELELATTGRDEVTIVDVYTHRSGETLSAALNRQCERQLYTARGWQQWMRATARMDGLIERGWHERALDYYDTLPPGVRVDRTLMLQRMLCARTVGPEAADAAWADLRRAWPDDPGADLFRLPRLLDDGRTQAAIECVERLRGLVHDDPFLDTLAAVALIEAGGFDRARVFIERAVRDEPDLELAWTLRLKVTLSRHEHDETARTLTILRERFGYRFKHLEGTDDYEAFVQSDAYGRWAAAR